MSFSNISAKCRLILGSLLVLLSAGFATAQVPVGPPTFPEPGLANEWDLLNPDGSAPIPGADAGVNININPDGTYTGEVWLDRGNGPVNIPSERLEIILVSAGSYVWENARGNYGVLIWNPFLGRYESVVQTGPNAGTHRILRD